MRGFFWMAILAVLLFLFFHGLKILGKRYWLLSRQGKNKRLKKGEKMTIRGYIITLMLLSFLATVCFFHFFPFIF